MNEEEVIVYSNKKYKLTKEGKRSDLYDLGHWWTKISAVVSGPVWRLYRKCFFGWKWEAVTNNPIYVIEWKKRYFSIESN